MSFQVDHLVVGAASLDQASAWCEAHLGLRPEPGGQHAWMGTHNRLLNLRGPAHPQCYLEFIAIDPDAPPPSGHRRWFGLDEPAIQARLAQGPQLLHWVARVPNVAAARAACLQLGADPGEPREASRGDLRWQISFRPDGLLPGAGAVPTLITWEGPHPSDRLPASPWQLVGLQLGVPAGLQATLRGPGDRLMTLSRA